MKQLRKYDTVYLVLNLLDKSYSIGRFVPKNLHNFGCTKCGKPCMRELVILFLASITALLIFHLRVLLSVDTHE